MDAATLARFDAAVAGLCAARGLALSLAQAALLAALRDALIQQPLRAGAPSVSAVEYTARSGKCVVMALVLAARALSEATSGGDALCLCTTGRGARLFMNSMGWLLSPPVPPALQGAEWTLIWQYRGETLHLRNALGATVTLSVMSLGRAQNMRGMGRHGPFIVFVNEPCSWDYAGAAVTSRRELLYKPMLANGAAIIDVNTAPPKGKDAEEEDLGL